MIRQLLASTICGAMVGVAFGQNASNSYAFSTLAGRALVSGAVDGDGGTARFNRPWGLALDAVGNVYVAEASNHTVRKITPEGIVTTLAGQAGMVGTADGLGTAARFGTVGSDGASTVNATGPFGIAVDSGRVAFVADGFSHTLRRIAVNGLVTTFAGVPGGAVYDDGPVADARFRLPLAIAIDATGTMFVADTYQHIIRRISATGIVTTIAGQPGSAGSADGIGNVARFLHPTAIAVSPTGIVYVSDCNNLVRRLSPTGTQEWSVTTIAGAAGTTGMTDGSGGVARFGGGTSVPSGGISSVRYTSTASTTISPEFITGLGYALGDLPGLAADAAGNVYVSDFSNNRIRKISPTGVVSTIGGSVSGSTDGLGSVARFSGPTGIAVDAAGNLYIADGFNHTIRKGSPAAAPSVQTQPGNRTAQPGETITLSVAITGAPAPAFVWTRNGLVIAGATASTLTLTNVQATHTGTYVVTATNSLGTATTVPFSLTISGAPAITTQPAGRTVEGGQSLTLSVTATGAPVPTYQWFRDGIPLSGATNPSLAIPNAQATNAGDYLVVVTNPAGSVTSSVARVTVNVSRIVNLSIRASLGGGETLIVGFVANGGAKPLLVRSVGPTLRDFGVTGAMGDPQLSLHAGAAVTATNDNWGSAVGAVANAARQVGAFALVENSLDAAVLATALDVPMTVQTSGRNNSAGIVLVELYDTAPTAVSRLVNVSARTRVGTGDNELFAGFVISGNVSRTLLIRAIGPTLTAFGVTNALTDPRLDIIPSGSSTPIFGNDNWSGDSTLIASFATVGAFPLPSVSSRDAALRVTLAPGAYSARISGVNGTTGEALLEIYEIP